MHSTIFSDRCHQDPGKSHHDVALHIEVAVSNHIPSRQRSIPQATRAFSTCFERHGEFSTFLMRCGEMSNFLGRHGEIPTFFWRHGEMLHLVYATWEMLHLLYATWETFHVFIPLSYATSRLFLVFYVSGIHFIPDCGGQHVNPTAQEPAQRYRYTLILLI